MHKLLPSRVIHRVLNIVIIVFVLQFSQGLYAQTLLLPGDLLVVTLNSTEDSFDFVPLVDISAGTQFVVSNGTWSDVTQKFVNGSEVQIQISTDIRAGQPLHISNQESSFFNTNDSLFIGGISSQLYLYQIDEDQHRFISSLHWNEPETVAKLYANGDIPETLLVSGNHFNLGDGLNFRYHLRYGASGSYEMLRTLIIDPEHWQTRNFPFEPLQTSLRLLEAPVVVFHEAISSVVEGETIPLNVAIYGHDGSRLTVDVVLNSNFSTTDTNDVVFPKKWTHNFTGLIGDAVIKVDVPHLDDDVYEQTETAFFQLENLNKGSFGDFINHAVFITDNELPNVQISEIYYPGNELLDYFEIQNNEEVEIDLKGWKLIGEGFGNSIGDIVLNPNESKRLYFRSFLTSNERVSWLSGNSGTINLVDDEDRVIASQEYELTSENLSQDNSITNRVDVRQNTALDLNPIQSTVIDNSLAIQTGLSEEEEEFKVPGWYGISVSNFDPFDGKEYMFWDEQSQIFRELDAASQDSLQGISLFVYESEFVSETESDFFNLESDSSGIAEEEVELFGEQEFVFRVSGSDRDENGIINDAEGFNLLVNEFDMELPVQVLLTELESQLGEQLIHPFVYVWPGNGLGWEDITVLDQEGIIPPNSSFWIKADSIISMQEIRFRFDNSLYQPIGILDDEPEPESYLVLELASGEEARDFSIQFFDQESERLPASSLQPQLNHNLFIGEESYLNFAGYDGTVWKDELNLWLNEDARTIVPLAFSSNESSQMKITVKDWGYIPNGWSVYLLDNNSGEQIEVNQALNLDIEYQYREYEEEFENEGIEFETRAAELMLDYSLVFVPPGLTEELFEEPEIIALHQNYPNPFNPVTTISFYLPETERVRLSVFNVVGQPVAVLANGTFNAGEHHFDWDATGFPSGMYIYQLEIKNQIMTRKMTLVK